MKTAPIVKVLRYWALVGESSIDGRLSGSDHWVKLDTTGCFAGDIARLIVIFDRWTNSLIHQRPRARGYDSVRLVIDGKLIAKFGESNKPGYHYEECWNRSVTMKVRIVPGPINHRQMHIDEILRDPPQAPPTQRAPSIPDLEAPSGEHSALDFAPLALTEDRTLEQLKADGDMPRKRGPKHHKPGCKCFACKVR